MSSCSLNLNSLSISQAITEAKSQKLQIPDEDTFRVSTLNQHGFMFTKFDPIVDRFLQSIEHDPNQTVFEVGGAYGNVAQTALEKGVQNYYLNDCEQRHLQLFAKKLEGEGKSHLFPFLHLIAGRCPEEVTVSENSFDKLLLNKVLPFFTPETIDSLLSWVHKGLKPGGQAYVMTISPFYKRHSALLAEYEKKKQEGERFPGFCPNYNESEIAQKYPSDARPAHLFFMDLETLKQLFVEHGFQIEEEFELAIIDQENPEWGPGKDMVGIIARKS